MTDLEKSNRLRFGEFAADLTTGELFKHGAKVPLQDKPFQILALLLRRPKQLLLRQEIIRNVWPDTFVEGDLCLNVAIRRLRSALNDDASHPHFIETVGSRGYRFMAAAHGSPTSEAVVSDSERPRVALFPLKSFMGAQSDSLAASITELLIIQLRRMNPPFAIVTPEFTTERAHKGKSTLSLCREVSADYVLVGAVLEADGEVRVTVRLLKCQAQACVWAESYTRQGEDRFGIQEDISRNIACSVIQSIPIPLRPSHLQLVAPSAHESYLHGCCFLSKLTEVAINRCIPLFDEAVRECPQFALAWAALANAHCALARLGIAASRKAFPKVKSAADKALGIEDLAEARTALAYYHFLYEHDWNAAEAAFVRALAIDSRHPLAVGGYAQLLVALGRPEDGVAMMRRACDLDPFSSYTKIMLGWTLYYSKNYEAAFSQLKHAVELDPSLWIGHTSMGMVLERLGDLDETVAEFRLAVEHSDNSFLAKAHLAYGLAKRGDKAGAGDILNSLLKLRQRHYFSPYWIAVVYTALNEFSDALKWLAIATEERCSWIVFAREDPKFSALHSDPRFRHIVDRVAAPTLEHTSSF
ncbi:MAG: winged helix-turn-helix domain-containing protein [Acidobacteriia bacterium]|nr:winged helix-turn-helix domain-containing protein [Terriglobia bacterium]